MMGWYNRALSAIKSPSLIKGLLFSSFLVSFNWLVFIWAVANGRVLESSLGYFLTPLVSVFLARVFLQETMNPWQVMAILLACLGGLWLILRIGYLPWVSLALAISFGLYGLVRKRLPVDTLSGLTVETALLLPLALAYWLYLTAQGEGFFYREGMHISLLLMASGIVTATPLLLFASATKRLSLTAVGFMMYINPTLQFLIGLYILHEPFSFDQLIGFCFIWCALLVFSIGVMRSGQHRYYRATDV